MSGNFVRPEEQWPFHNTECGAILQIDRFYCFGDAGGLAGDFKGYTSADEAKNYLLKNEVEEKEISTDPEDLGGVAITILSGRQFIDRLYLVGGDEKSFFLEFGYWDNMTEDEAQELRNQERIQG